MSGPIKWSIYFWLLRLSLELNFDNSYYIQVLTYLDMIYMGQIIILYRKLHSDDILLIFTHPLQETNLNVALYYSLQFWKFGRILCFISFSNISILANT